MYAASRGLWQKYAQRRTASMGATTTKHELDDHKVQARDRRPQVTEDRSSEGQDSTPHILLEAHAGQQHSEHTRVSAGTDAVAHKRHLALKYKVLFGLALPFALSSLDVTILASALPSIASVFNQTQQLNWIVAAFNLTAAAFLPAWSQMADIFGRHGTLQAAMLILGIGSAICTGAPISAFGVLLLGRALQGLGAAGINIVGHTIMADRASLEDYAWNWTLAAIISAIFFSIGPIIGGHLVQVNWRWCFAINLPVLAAAILAVIIILSKELIGPQPLPGVEDRTMSSRRSRIWKRLMVLDYGGQALFLSGLVLLILALTWAGGAYPWGSVRVILPLILGAVLVVVWIIYEHSMSPHHTMSRIFPLQRAMMPWNLLSQKDIGLLFWINFSEGMASFAVMYFMDIYFTLVLGHSPSEAGENLLFYLPGLGVGAFLAQYSSNAWPRQTIPPLLAGGTSAALGITLLVPAIDAGNTKMIFGMMALTGFGIGLRINPASVHALAFVTDMNAQITCLMVLAEPLGGTIGLTLMSTLFNNKSGFNHDDPKTGVKYAFIVIIPFMWLAVIVTTFLGNTWILSGGKHEIVREPYIWAILGRKKVHREQRHRGEAATDALTRERG